MEGLRQAFILAALKTPLVDESASSRLERKDLPPGRSPELRVF